MSDAAQPATSSVLIVDDDADFRDLLQSILGGAGYRTGLASDGREALERLDRESFDVILLDIWMPRMNGLEMLTELRARWLLPKVIVMSGDNQPETLLSAVREQAYQYITKPFQPSELLDMVADVLAAPAASASIEVISALPHWVELAVPCEKPVADRIQGFLDKLDTQIPEDVRRNVGTAFREMLLNAVEWGGRLDPGRRVRISYMRLKKMLLYRIADPGSGFQVEGLQHSALNNPEQEPFRHVMVREERGMRPGGFGILLAQSMVDELLYNEARNEVVLVKYLES
jgi:CheY-like chemotaxis protein/anti-sigma regulatory factor (Ser/Thr protein kinase)